MKAPARGTGELVANLPMRQTRLATNPAMPALEGASTGLPCNQNRSFVVRADVFAGPFWQWASKGFAFRASAGGGMACFELI